MECLLTIYSYLVLLCAIGVRLIFVAVTSVHIRTFGQKYLYEMQHTFSTCFCDFMVLISFLKLFLRN